MNMMTLKSFYNELQKIAASHSAATHVKSRSGRRPVRVDTLLKKHSAATVNPGILSSLIGGIIKHKKPLALMGLGGVGTIKGQQAIKDYQLGKAVRKQQGQ